MGGNGKHQPNTTTGAGELIALILRELDAANAHLAALREAVSAALSKAVTAREEQKRIAELKADLDAAWKRASRSIERLEQMSGTPEKHARNALSESRASARDTFDLLWTLITTNRSE
jgi:hypothetical protein